MPSSRCPSSSPALALTIAVAFAGGCRSYGPSPLALDVHESTFVAREASASEVAEFARSLAPAAAGGADFDPSDGLSVAEAEIVALVFNPDLRERRLAAGVIAAGAAHAADWDDPRLGLDLTRILDGGDWEAIGSLSLTIPISGRLEIERAKADAEHLVALEELARAEWLVRAEVRRRFAKVSASAARVTAAEVHLARIEEIDRLVRTLEERGELARIEARLFAIDRATAAAELASLRADLERARIDLARALGLAKVPPLAVDGIGAGSDPIDTGDAPRNPDVRVARAAYAVAERALEVEVRRQFPDLEIGPGYGKQDGDRQFELGLSVPIPVLSANRRAINEAEAARELARARAEHAVERFLLDRAVATADIERAVERRERIEREIAPLVDAQESEVRRVVALGGEVTSLVVLESVKRQHEARLDLIEARLEEALARIELGAIAGETASGTVESQMNDGADAPKPEVGR